MADPEILIPIFIAGVMPISIVGIVSYFRFKTKQLAASKEDPKRLAAHDEERKQLEARVQNLESIVCSVDLELNARLNRVLAQQSQVLAQPAMVTPPLGSAATSTPVALGATMAAVALPAAGAAPGGNHDGSAATLSARGRGEAGLSPTVQARGSLLAMALEPGQKIAGRYTIERELGRGGMGSVYLAADHKLGERVALKIINTAFAGDLDAAAERFRREVQAARKITHPNVIRIHDLIEDGQMLLLSMEYVEGMTLATYLGRVGSLRIDEGRHFIGQMCDGLGAAHVAGVVHRDLKPGNVLLDAQKRVKLIDFGLAKASFLAGMTATGLIMGTPEYMAPEQIKGLGCDARTDLYALGALAYHVFVGRPPFGGETPIAIGFAHVSEPVRPPRQLRPELPEPLERALLQALEKDPARRFVDAAEMKRALGA